MGTQGIQNNGFHCILKGCACEFNIILNVINPRFLTTIIFFSGEYYTGVLSKVHCRTVY